MMKNLAYLFAALSIAVSASCVAASTNQLTKNLCASNTNRLVEVDLNTLIEEDDYLYFFDKITGVKYGETISNKSPFISTGNRYFFAKDITFTNLDRSVEKKFDDRDLLIQQATFYRYKDRSKTMICLVSQFGGLGQSGSYQKYQWAIVFPKDAKTITQLKGRFGM